VVADFGQRLFTISDGSKPVHLFVDEADEFAPQRGDFSSYPHQKRCLGAIDRIVRRARIKGIGVTMVTQRSAVISKNVLSQVEGLFAMAAGAEADIEAVEGWMRRGIRRRTREACLAQLPKLGRGESFYLQIGAGHKLRRITVRTKMTYDSSRTPKPGEVLPSLSYSVVSEDALSIARPILVPPSAA
jgi:hypothetical protein